MPLPARPSRRRALHRPPPPAGCESAALADAATAERASGLATTAGGERRRGCLRSSGLRHRG